MSYFRTNSVLLFVLFVLAAGDLLSGIACSNRTSQSGGVAQTGIASWYGHPFDGRLTANGEVYEMEKLTAAHRTFPFGTVLRVENVANHKTVEVRINDRGPFVQGRIIDLSHAAAQTIAMPGIANVHLQVLSAPATRAAELYAVQLQSFSQKPDAERLRDKMQQEYGSARIVYRSSDRTWRVLVGLESSIEAANALEQNLEKEAGPGFVVMLDED